MWPDVWIKDSSKYSKSCPKSNHKSFYLKSDVFKITEIVTKYLCYIFKQICHQEELSKIAQSGHTATLVHRHFERFSILILYMSIPRDSCDSLPPPRAWSTPSLNAEIRQHRYQVLAEASTDGRCSTAGPSGLEGPAPAALTALGGNHPPWLK